MSITEFIKEKIKELEGTETDISTIELYTYYDECVNKLNSVNPETYNRAVRRQVELYYQDFNKILLDSNVSLAKNKQKVLDINRIERKTFRGHARIDNALIEYNKELINVLSSISEEFKKITIVHETNDSDIKGIVQLSDVHANELINLPNNKYDFSIMSKRLKKLAMESIKLFVDNGVTSVVIAMTGDMINSDRRLDELLSKATNRSRATILTSYIISQFIIELNKYFKITVTCVSGNESRVNDEHGYSDIIATDNYDWTIFEILSLMFNKSDSISFIRGGTRENIININNKNILLLHGEYVKNSDIEKQIEQTKGRYTSREIILDYIIVGHRHSCKIGDTYARSSSMCGANAYSETGLNLNGRASQNIFLVNTNSINGMRIDLQNVDNIIGYDIVTMLEDYNCKSYDKLNANIKQHII